jgi:hypothetical protein
MKTLQRKTARKIHDIALNIHCDWKSDKRKTKIVRVSPDLCSHNARIVYTKSRWWETQVLTDPHTNFKVHLTDSISEPLPWTSLYQNLFSSLGDDGRTDRQTDKYFPKTILKINLFNFSAIGVSSIKFFRRFVLNTVSFRDETLLPAPCRYGAGKYIR